jgi:aminoglycoside phosphotransferase (APT) family kinase protein
MNTSILLNLPDYLHRAYPEKGKCIISNLNSLNIGWESDVYGFTVEWKEIDSPTHENLILRIYPGKDAYDKSEKEFRALQLLSKVGYPVPRVDFLERDPECFERPFIIMEQINGEPLWRTMFKGSEERQKHFLSLFCKLLAHLHNIDWRSYVDHPEQYEPPGAHALIERQLAAWQSYPIRTLLPGFGPIMDWLMDHRFSVISQKASLLHWDFHPENILLRDDGSAVVIDWTGFEISDRRFDLAWTLIVVCPNEGMHWRERILREYERAAGFTIEGIEYFEVAACLRRLFSVLVSLAVGAEQLGMRPGAEKQMLGHAPRLKIIHDLLVDRTGLRIPEVDQFLEKTGVQ